MKTKHWLKSNVCIEPLVNSWYACTQLISPTTASLIFEKRFLKILRSCIDYPTLHDNASIDKKLNGGSFLHLNNIKLDAIKTLYSKTLNNSKKLLELAKSIDTLNLLLEQSNGNSLEQLYPQIPKLLAGCVELVYDMHHHASIRFIEKFIYHRFYDDSLHTILLSCYDIDRRPYILSTPRFCTEENIQITIPLNSEIIDLLSKSRRSGIALDVFYEILNLPITKKTTFESLFSNIPPSPPNKSMYDKDIKIRYFGHACILIETRDISILIDPFIAYGNEPDCFNINDLPNKIDYVLISHSHQDHFCIETLIQIRHLVENIVVPDNNTGFLADPSLKIILEHIGFKSIITLKEMERINLKFVKITGIPFLGEHGDLNIQSKLAYHIRVYEKSFLFAVDSNNLDSNLYRIISDIIGPLDMLFIGMECVGAPFSWAYGSLFHKNINNKFDQSRRLNSSNSEKILSIKKELDCQQIIIYAMGREPWLNHITGINYSENSKQIKEANKLLYQCNIEGMPAEMLFKKREWLL